MRDAPAEKELIIPLVSEELRIEKRDTSTGKVRVQTVVETVDELACTTIVEDSLDVQRVPIGKVVDEPPGVRTEGDVTIIPVLKETMIVEKRLMLVEEVHIRRTRSSREVEMPVTLRQQKAVIVEVPSDTQTAGQEDR
jgi:stress response protein YsnF